MPKPNDRKEDAYRYENVVRACLNDVWAMEERKLDQIRAFLELKARGGMLTVEEIQAAIGGRPRALREESRQQEIIDGVGLVRLIGPMAPRMNLMQDISGGVSTQRAAADIRELLDNPGVKRIVLEIDSPGGVVTGTEELRRVIFNGRQRKPITAVIQGQGASAAYYVASAATRLLATPSSEIGSVGVFAILYEATEAAEDAGLKFYVFRAGALKAAGNPYEKLTKERQAALQARVDGPYLQFVAAVSENRGVSPQTVENTYGQGTVFLANQALALGMIDGIVDSLDDAIVSERLQNRVVVTITEGKSMDKKILAAMFARGLVESMEVGDAAAKAILAGYFAGRGEKQPEDVAAIVSALMSNPSPKASEPVQPTTGSPKTSEPVQPTTGGTAAAAGSPTAAAAPPADQADTAQRAALAERNRIADVHARAALLGVDSTEIQSAIDSGDGIEKIVDRWTRQRAVASKPLTLAVGGESSADKFCEQATASLMNQIGLPSGQAKPGHLANSSLSMIAGEAIRVAGGRVPNVGDREQVALEFLKLGGTDNMVVSASEGSVNRPGDFPHLLSNLANKILDTTLPMAQPSYPIWTAKLADVPDFKPMTIHTIGGAVYLDEIPDDDDTPQTAMVEETPAWVQVGRYGNKVGLTPVMVANDDLDGFSQGLQSLAYAHENTLNALCIALITSNVTMPDGVALFHASSHGNLITSTGPAGVPSATTLAANRAAHMTQAGINGGYVNTWPAILLCPVALISTAEAVCLTPAQLYEVKTPATDGNVNVFRGRIMPVADPLLDASSTAYWYTLADKNVRRTICHVFQRGYGRGGQRSTWFSNENKTRWFDLEGRFAAVAASWRGIVCNDGA